MLKFSKSFHPTTQIGKQSASILLALGLSLAIWRPALGQLPVARLTSIFPAGGRVGEKVDVTIAGSDLEDASRLLFSHPGITAEPKMRDPGQFETGPQPVTNQFTVTVAANVPPGQYEARAAGKYGLSNPRRFAVGMLTETLEKEPNNTPDAAQEIPLDGIVNGRSDRASDLDYYRFTAKEGQRVLIECRARPLDSRLDGALAVFDAGGRELAHMYDGSLNDPLLDFTAPADGDYTLKVHDFVYAGGGEYGYRLSVSTKPRVDFVFPPAGLPGSKATYRVFGRNLPGGQPAPEVKIGGKPLEVVTVEIQLPGGAAAESLPAASLIEPPESGIDAFPYRLPTPQGPAEPVLIGFAKAPVVVEQEPNNEPEQAQKVSAPCECAGQFYPQGDKDWFAFEAKQGEKYVIEVISQRQGAITDPFLLVEQVTTDKEGKQQVKELKSEDDVGDSIGESDFAARHDDPVYRFTAPADGTYRVLVRDLYFSSRGDPRFTYRLAIRPEQPDFRLVAMPKFTGAQPNANQNQPVLWSSLLRKGGTTLVELMVFRRDGFNGEITVTAEGLPQGVSAQPVVIGSGENKASLVLTAAADAPRTESAALRIVGKAKEGDKQLSHQARAACIVWPGQLRRSSTHSRLSADLALAVTDAEEAPFLVAPGKQAAFEMCRGGKLEIPLAVTRRAEFKGAVQLTAEGLPKGFPRNTNLTVAANAKDGKLALTIPPKAPLGTSSFYLRGTSKHNYSRNPEAAAAAAKRKDELTKIAAEAAQAAKTAVAAKQAADKAFADADQKAKAAEQASDAAAKASQQAEAAVKAAAQASEAAKKAVAAEPGNDALAKKATEADKQLADAKAAHAKAVDAANKAKAAAEQTAKAAQAAKEKQTAAAKAAAEADTRNKAAAKAKTDADKAAAQATAAAKAKSVNIGYPSQSITLSITEAPMTLAITAPGKPLKAGEKLEVPVQISRLYDYADPVQLAVAVPKGVSGLKIVAAPVPAKQNQSKLVIEAAPNATAGKHSLTVTASSKLNGQTQQLTQNVVVEVTPAEAAKK